MNCENYNRQVKSIQVLVLCFIVLLVLSGITAFPVQTEMQWMVNGAKHFPAYMQAWILKVNAAVGETAEKFPFLFYGYDWLAFSHLVIALFFTGVYRDPLRNAWVLRCGLIACAGVFVLAFVCGPVRGIPLPWTLVDCSFGFFGGVLLLVILRKIKRMERQISFSDQMKQL